MNGTIQLEGLEFFAFHGFYDEEQKLGNRYSVDILVELPLSTPSNSDRLADTVSYAELFQLATQAMQQPSRLLENVAKRLIDNIMARYTAVQYCEVSIAKHNPPLGGLCQKARITLREKRA